MLTRWKVLWENTNPHESFFVTNTWQHLPHLPFCGPLVPNFPMKLFCKQLPVFVNNHRFMEFFDRYFHIPLPIVTKHELGLPFPPRNLCIKFGANPSTIFLVIMVIDRQTHKPTPVKTFPHFRGDKINCHYIYGLIYKPPFALCYHHSRTLDCFDSGKKE